MKYDLTFKSFAFGFFYFAIANSISLSIFLVKQLYSILKTKKGPLLTY